MSWSNSSLIGNKTIINKHSLRVVLLVSLAWIVLYNFQHYDQPDRPVTDTQHRPFSPDVTILTGGPQIGQANVELALKDGTAQEEKIQVLLPPQDHALDSAAANSNDAASAALLSSVPQTSATPVTQPAPKHSNTATSPPPKQQPIWLKTHIQDPSDPITRLIMTRNQTPTQPASLLALIMTKDASSWGSNGGPQRTFASYLSMLRSSGLDLSTVSLGILTSDLTESKLYETMIEQDEEKFASATIILHPGYMDRPRSGDEQDSDWRASRHDNNIQHDRRAEMARLRNYLMFSALDVAPEARNMLWVDADVYELSDNLLPEMVQQMDGNETVGVLTVISHFGGGDSDYDLNAYRGGRSKPNEEQRKKLREDIGSWTAGMENGHHIHHVLEKLKTMKEKAEREKAGDGAFDPAKATFEERTDDKSDPWWQEDEVAEVEGLLRLDAVGATVVMLKTGLVRQGLAFSTSYLVGTDWQGEGWDAVESEGLCVTARTLGAKCFAMINGYSSHCVG
jgi:hypothetical protein